MAGGFPELSHESDHPAPTTLRPVARVAIWRCPLAAITARRRLSWLKLTPPTVVAAKVKTVRPVAVSCPLTVDWGVDSLHVATSVPSRLSTAPVACWSLLSTGGFGSSLPEGNDQAWSTMLFPDLAS